MTNKINILYIVRVDFSRTKNLGLLGKIKGQLKAFNSYGNSYLINILSNKLVLNDSNNVQTKIANLNFFTHFFIFKKYKELHKVIKEKNISYIYIRFPILEHFFLSFLKKIKKKYKNIKIVLEFPTYPYYSEWSGLSGKIKIFLDKIYNKQLKKYITHATTYTYDGDIYNIPTLYLQNACDPSTLKIKKHTTKSNILNIIGVANISIWHGWDRLIKGLKDYYNESPKIKVIFTVVGEGPHKNELESLVKNYKLEKYVDFKGKKYGEELDTLFNNAHIATEGLGLHRIGLKYCSSIKSREYTARGIPFISGSHDKDFDSNYKYRIEFSQNEDPININQILDFYNSIYSTNMEKEIRDYAEENLSWGNQISKIMEFNK